MIKSPLTTVSRLEKMPSRIEATRMTAALVDIFILEEHRFRQQGAVIYIGRPVECVVLKKNRCELRGSENQIS